MCKEGRVSAKEPYTFEKETTDISQRGAVFVLRDEMGKQIHIYLENTSICKEGRVSAKEPYISLYDCV